VPEGSLITDWGAATCDKIMAVGRFSAPKLSFHQKRGKNRRKTPHLTGVDSWPGGEFLGQADHRPPGARELTAVADVGTCPKMVQLTKLTPTRSAMRWGCAGTESARTRGPGQVNQPRFFQSRDDFDFFQPWAARGGQTPLQKKARELRCVRVVKAALGRQYADHVRHLRC